MGIIVSGFIMGITTLVSLWGAFAWWETAQSKHERDAAEAFGVTLFVCCLVATLFNGLSQLDLLEQNEALSSRLE